MAGVSASRVVGSRRVAPRTWSVSAIALADQIVVSGTSFATAVAVARFAGPSELGTYALGVSLYLMAAMVQDALVTVPYSVLGAASVPPGAMLRRLWQIAAAAMTVVALAAGYDAATGASHAGALAVLALVMPVLLARELVRRVSLAELNPRLTLTVDVGVASAQLTGVALLSATGALDARLAFATVGGASALGVGVWWLATRHRDPGAPHDRSAVQAAARLGRSVLASRVVMTIHSDGIILWMLARVADPATLGLFVAGAALMSFANPLVLGLASVATPLARSAYAHGGRAAAGRAIRRTARLVVVTTGGVGVVLVIAGSTLAAALYGPGYVFGETLLALLAGATAATAVGTAFATGLFALDRADVNLEGAALGLVATTMLAVVCMRWRAAEGAALALLVGQTLSTAWRGWRLARILERDGAGSTRR